MAVIMPVGPGWGRVQAQGTETFTVPDLPAGAIFYGFQPTYSEGSKLEIYMGGVLVKTRLFDVGNPNETSSIVGRITHSGGDLTFVCTPSIDQPYNVYALGWGHATLDEDPTHWGPYSNPTWIINQYPNLQGSTGDYSANNVTYGSGIPTSVMGLGPHEPQSPGIEGGCFAGLTSGGIRSSNLSMGLWGRNSPAGKGSSLGSGFTLSRHYGCAMVQGAIKIKAVDIETLPFVWKATQDGIDYYGTGSWGGMSYGFPSYKPPRLFVGATSSRPEDLGICKIRALQGGARIEYPEEGFPDDRVPLNKWTSGMVGWQVGGGQGSLPLVREQAFVSPGPGYPVPEPVTMHEFPEYMQYAIEDPAQPTGFVPKFLRFVSTSSILDQGVFPTVPSNMPTGTEGNWSNGPLETLTITSTVGARLELEHKSPPARTYLGFPLLLGVLKVKIEDLVYWPDYGPWWTSVGTGNGYAAMKVATTSTWDLEQSPRWAESPSLPLYVMTADGWRRTSRLLPPAPEAPL